MRRYLGLVVVLALQMSAFPLSSDGQALDLVLPTSNDALLRDDAHEYYMYTDRTFEGRRSRPWQGGQYGFVRNPKRTARGIVFTRFHEGVDIQPLYRTASGEPLDTVRAVDEGTVVHANRVERHSSYGKYVVVEHWWGGSPFYSLYAHMNSVVVRAGQRVGRGQPLGRMGYTGRGINRRRAHLHFEINMLLNTRFQQWFDRHFRSSNRHGVYNGMNLAGLDVAALYLALQNNPDLTIQEFLSRQEVFFRVRVPNEGLLDVVTRYPWLTTHEHPWLAVYDRERVKAWDISFTRSGLPLRVEPVRDAVAAPMPSVVQEDIVPYGYLTERLLGGASGGVTLGRSGIRYLELLMLGAEENVPPPVAYPPAEAVSGRPPDAPPSTAGSGGNLPYRSSGSPSATDGSGDAPALDRRRGDPSPILPRW